MDITHLVCKEESCSSISPSDSLESLPSLKTPLQPFFPTKPHAIPPAPILTPQVSYSPQSTHSISVDESINTVKQSYFDFAKPLWSQSSTLRPYCSTQIHQSKSPTQLPPSSTLSRPTYIEAMDTKISSATSFISQHSPSTLITHTQQLPQPPTFCPRPRDNILINDDEDEDEDDIEGEDEELHVQYGQQIQGQPQQRVECGLCGKSFSGISSHNRHVSRTHHNARPFSCADCGLQFGQKGSLDRHTAAVHLKARPFSCDFCGKGFGRKDNMKIHVTTVHLKRKPFKCDMCPKSFGGKRPLKIHRQTVHFKQRPLKCPYCDKRFGQRSNLNVHIKVHNRAAAATAAAAVTTTTIGSHLSTVLISPTTPPHSPVASVSDDVHLFPRPGLEFNRSPTQLRDIIHW